MQHNNYEKKNHKKVTYLSLKFKKYNFKKI